MIIAACRTSLRASLVASLVLSSWATVASADALVPAAEASASPSAAEPPAPSGSVGAAAAASDSASSASGPSPGPIERLPPTAYPTEPLRGLYGGSLWRTFHGQQWPYYPRTGIGVSGYGWVDTGYEHIHRGNPAESSIKYFVQQGRMVLRLTPTWSDGAWFVQGQGEFVANEDQSQAPPLQADVDDMWIKFGRWRLFDVQIGRFEAWEIYHFGMGLDLYTLERQGATDTGVLNAPAIYGVTYNFYRPQSIGAGAVHLYATNWLRFELGARYGDEGGQNGYGVRPVAVFDLGFLKVKAGYEYLDLTPQGEGAKGETQQQGFGGAVQVIVDPWVEAGVNFAYGMARVNSATDNNPSPGQSFDTYSAGAFLNARIIDGLLIGGGINYTYLVNQQYDSALGRDEDFDHWQGFGAIQYWLFKKLFIKGVVGYALANFNPNMGAIPFTNEMVSGRLRLEYLY